MISVKALEPGHVIEYRGANVMIISPGEVKRDIFGRNELAFQARIVGGDPNIGREGEIRYGFTAQVKPWKIKGTV